MAPSYKAQDLFNANGLVALTTGGGGGIGLYAVWALDAIGAKAVYIMGRCEPNASGCRQDCDQWHSQANRWRCDRQGFTPEGGQLNAPGARLHQPAVCKCRYLRTKTRRCIIWKAHHKEIQEAWLNPDMDDFTKTQHVHITAVFYTIVTFLDLLDAGNKKRNLSQDSQILVTSSVSGFSRTLFSGVAYPASKAVVNHIVTTLSTFSAQNNFRIRANIIAPSLFPSELTSGFIDYLDQFTSEGHEGVLPDARKIDPGFAPAACTGSEEDFAGLILFLASRADAYINGEAILIDGGRASLVQ